MSVTAEVEKRTLAFEIRCYRRLLNILYKDHVTCSNKEVLRKIQATTGKYDELLTLVKKQNLRRSGWVSMVFWFSKDDPTGHNNRKEKER